MKQQRRVFLQVVASVPLACGAGEAEESPSGVGGGSGSGGGVAGTPPAAGGRGGTVAAGGTGSGAGSSAIGGSGSGGSPFSNAGTFGSSGTFGSAGTSPISGGSDSGASGAGGSGGTAVDEPLPGEVVTNLSQVPVGAFIVAGGLYFVGRDAAGLYAMSMQCTHKGCTVNMSGNELLCPCHQARFARDGRVLGGPAPTPLPHLAVYVDAAGNISVDKYTTVSATMRVPV